MVARAGVCREMKLQAFLYNNVRLVRLVPSRIEIQGGDYVDAAIVQKLRLFLKQETLQDWVVSLSNETGQPTLKEQDDSAQDVRKNKMREHPVVQSVLQAFPGSDITDILDHPPTDPSPQ
jgi:DNA polymerase-3 subunit gamma/tau